MTIEISFQQLLTLVKSLTPTQKARLRKELGEDQKLTKEKDDVIDFLLSGPVFNEKDIAIIKNNRKSITTWRTKGL